MSRVPFNTVQSLRPTACGTPCEQLSAADCSGDDSCTVIQGRPLDSPNECVGELQAAGCHEAGGDCGDAITIAVHARATPWQFNNTCIPEGWTVVDDVSTSDWSDCSE